MLLRVDTDKPNQGDYSASGEAYGGSLPIIQNVIDVDTWYEVKLQLTDLHWDCYLNGEKLIDYDDDPEWAYLSGIIGFSIDCGQAAIDDVKTTGVDILPVEPMGSMAALWGRIKDQ